MVGKDELDRKLVASTNGESKAIRSNNELHSSTIIS
jgi:hypothetical protein